MQYDPSRNQGPKAVSQHAAPGLYLDYRCAYELAESAGGELADQLEIFEAGLSQKMEKISRSIETAQKELTSKPIRDGGDLALGAVILYSLIMFIVNLYIMVESISYIGWGLLLWFGGALAIWILVDVNINMWKEEKHHTKYGATLGVQSAKLKYLDKLSSDLKNLYQKVLIQKK